LATTVEGLASVGIQTVYGVVRTTPSGLAIRKSKENDGIRAGWLPAAEHPAADQPERQRFRHTDDTAGWSGKP